MAQLWRASTAFRPWWACTRRQVVYRLAHACASTAPTAGSPFSTRKACTWEVSMVQLTADELVAYTNEERKKWNRWFVDKPQAMSVPVHAEMEKTIHIQRREAR